MPVAVVTVVGAFAIRAIIRAEWVPFLRIVDAHADVAREADEIWKSFAEPRHAREFAVFAFGPWLIDQFRTKSTAASAASIRALVKIVREQWITGCIAFALAVIAFLWLGMDGLSGRLSSSDLAVAMIAVTGTMSMSFMGWEAWDIDYGLASMRAYRRIEARAAEHGRDPEHEPGRRRSPADAPAVEAAPRITLDRVAFAYPRQAVLRSVSLDIRPGERLALVGRNGAGKSTLTKLLGGLQEPSSGTISFDGHPIHDVEGRRLASSVAIMNQEALRLPLDIRMNVTLGAPATDDEVWAALELAGLREVFERRRIMLSTPLWNTTDAATDLSGGQWQRLTLARAILAARRGKRVLILDEPTSQYDVRGETNFYNTVMAELAGVTVVLITHRLSTVRRADRIALLQDGRISEVGTHDELLDHGGAYAAMFRAQRALPPRDLRRAPRGRGDPLLRLRPLAQLRGGLAPRRHRRQALQDPAQGAVLGGSQLDRPRSHARRRPLDRRRRGANGRAHRRRPRPGDHAVDRVARPAGGHLGDRQVRRPAVVGDAGARPAARAGRSAPAPGGRSG